MQFSRRRPAEEADVNITPLIDVVFLLLIFFMVTTTFQVTSGIKVDLPDSDAQMSDQNIRRVVISIKADGGIYVGQDLVTIEALNARLAETAKENPDAMVVIRADQGVIHGQVVNVMDAARRAGLKKMAIATTLKSER